MPACNSGRNQENERKKKSHLEIKGEREESNGETMDIQILKTCFENSGKGTRMTLLCPEGFFGDSRY